MNDSPFRALLSFWIFLLILAVCVYGLAIMFGYR